jgi:hypothetical protein
MKERSEEEVVAKKPLTVTLGSTKYSIQLLGITPQQEWRVKLTESLFPVLDSFAAKTLKEALVGGLTGALMKFPQELIKLLFEYAPDLPKDKIMLEATEEQVALAFTAIMSVAYPFVPQLTTVTSLWRTK